MSAQTRAEACMRGIEAVLRQHGAELYIATAARLWIDGAEVGEIWTSETDGTTLEFVDQSAATPGDSAHGQ